MMVTADPSYCEDIETDDKSFSSFSLPHIPPPFPKHDFWGKGSGAVEDLWRSLTPGPMGRLADQKEVTVTFLPSFPKETLEKLQKRSSCPLPQGNASGIWNSLPKVERPCPALQSKTPAECVLDVGQMAGVVMQDFFVEDVAMYNMG